MRDENGNDERSSETMYTEIIDALNKNDTSIIELCSIALNMLVIIGCEIGTSASTTLLDYIVLKAKEIIEAENNKV